MRKLLGFAAAVEAVTGLAFIVAPAPTFALLAGSNVVEHAVPLGRVFGLGLLAFGMACWPRGQRIDRESAAFRAVMAYNVLAAPSLAVLGAAGYWRGSLLWPGVALHAVVALLMVRASRQERSKPDN